MSGPRTYTWSNRGFRWSMLSLLGLTVVAMFVGFIWLPAVHPDFESDGLWASICRAAGLPYRWGGAGQAGKATEPISTNVVLDLQMARAGTTEAVGRGATGAPLRNIAPCISCHGGVDQKLGAPWLEGMPKAYLVTQLKAFASGARRNDSEAQMRNMARPMTESEIDAVATFYARKAQPAGLSVISCSRHMMLPRRMYASQTESQTGGSAGDSRRVAGAIRQRPDDG